jgi:hypothetical protein
MSYFSLPRLIRPVPAEYRTNFIHLYLDIAWFGVLSGSAMAFVALYAARQGANAYQLGLITAGPAFINLIFTLPAGRWLETQRIGAAVFWASILHRFFYLRGYRYPSFWPPKLKSGPS